MKRETIVILETAAGDVRTAFGPDNTAAAVETVADYLATGKKFRIEYVELKTVKNLMTGKPVDIPADTPWCCNPASETFWSM